MSVQIALLPRCRLHLQHGPIDLIIAADGPPEHVRRAYRAAADVFPDILPGLVDELPILRAQVGERPPLVTGPVATRMTAAVWPYRDVFITPMAAVAGSVADFVLERMCRAADLRRAYVNNGGDIAVHLAAGESYEGGVVGDLGSPVLDGRMTLRASDGIGGVATSGWRGRSLSLGVADAVTILSTTAAAADAAATIVANAVNVDHPAVVRRPACDVRDDSDLLQMPVTLHVGALPPAVRRRALEAGVAKASELIGRGMIRSAVLQLQGEIEVVDRAAAALRAA